MGTSTTDRKAVWLWLTLLAVIHIIGWRAASRLHHVDTNATQQWTTPAATLDVGELLWKRDAPGSESIDLFGAGIEQVNPTARNASAASGIAFALPLATSPNGDPSRPRLAETPCDPLPLTLGSAELCAHVRAHCPPTGHFDYRAMYYCVGVDESDGKPGGHEPHPPSLTIHTAQGIVLALIILWMLFLFSGVGIVASDFFCPNLSTIAARLGLNESTTGVTFLAFGNGSPDVFSTFGAMKSGSGSLAIGELLGAASFIVSVISGSMMLIAPFRVKPYPFLRDVGFFTVAVALTMTCLFDGRLRRSESIALIALYVAYAATVIIGTWYQERRRIKKLVIAAARSEYESDHRRNGTPDPADISVGHASDVERGNLDVPHGSPYGAMSPIEYDPDEDPLEVWNSVRGTAAADTSVGSALELEGTTAPSSAPSPAKRTPSMSSMLQTQSRFRPGAIPRHSLLGAVEFRDVVRSLQAESSADRSMLVFQSRDPERFFPHPQHHHHHRSMHRTSSTGSAGATPPAAERRSMHKRFQSLVGPVSAIDPGQSHDHLHARAKSIGGDQARPLMSRNRTVDEGLLNRAGDTADDYFSRAVGEDTNLPAAPSGRLVDLSDAPGIDDPWREAGGPSDLSDESPATELARSKREQSEADKKRLELPKLGLPRWEDAGKDDEAGDQLALPSGGEARKSPVPSIVISVEGGDDRQATANAEHPLSLEMPYRDEDSEETSVATPRPHAASSDHRKAGEIPPERRYSLLFRARTELVRTRRALFPSLRHFHDKSYLGITLSIATAPALFALNLTLPVVDDELEAQAAQARNGRKAAGGALRLEGDEAQLLARSLEEQEREENARVDYEVAGALRAVPEARPKRATQREREEADDDTSSVASWDSADSHFAAPDKTLNAHLFPAQCLLAPPFITWAVFNGGEGSVLWKVGLALLVGASMATLVLLARVSTELARRKRREGGVRSDFEEEGSSRARRLASGARCAMGFVVSVVWIMTIVDEVVSILQTLGTIVGVSDAILGLTVFAVGNSLGDLVANVTIAKMGHPVMAISACFAGPLLNLLLGIGISGTWLLSSSSAPSASALQPPTILRHHHTLSPIQDGTYVIDFSPTLLVSGCGLLCILVGTLIAVPLNGFLLSRKLGFCLIAAYACIMVTNVLVEVLYVMKRD